MLGLLVLIRWLDRLHNGAATVVGLWLLGLAFGLGMTLGALVAGLG